jgi:hypothetical protein
MAASYVEMGACSLEARIVESQQSAVTRQWPLNDNRGRVFPALSVLRSCK